MRFAEFIPLVGCICNLLIALLVLIYAFRGTQNRVYFFLDVAISVWNLGSFLLFMSEEHDAALFWARFLQFGVIPIPVLLFHLSLLIAEVKVGRYIWAAYACVLALMASNATSLFIQDVRILGSVGWYAVAGPACRFWSAVPFNLVFVSLIVLLQRRRALPARRRARLHPLIAAQLLLVLLGTNDILPIIGIDRYPGTSIYVYPFGSLGAIFYGIIIGYSVLQHQLLDVQVALSRISAHILRFGFLMFTGLALLLGISIFAPGQFTTVSFFSSLFVLAACGIIASVVFPRLFGSGSDFVERRLLGDRFEYHDQIRAFIASMPFHHDANELLDGLEKLLIGTMGVRSYDVIVFDDTKRVFSIMRSYPEQQQRELPSFDRDSPVFRLMETTKADYLALNPDHVQGGTSEVEIAAREQLREFRSEICFPFFFQDEPFGLLVVGEKSTGDRYTVSDINILASLVKNLSSIINQIRLKSHILHTQEMELLGRMSRGMAHDLNNLLTPVWTLLQLAGEGASFKDLEDLTPVALRNVTTMRAYIREALFYSENLRPDLQVGRLDVLIAHAGDVLKAKLESHRVNITVETPGEVMIEMDEVLIQRTISNIISNAIDASPAHSTVRVELVRLFKTEVGREWLRVRVIDSGSGIKPEDLNRIFTPYFTTKNRGDEDRGFGLGLAICRKIVHLHGGNLTVSSKVKKGTTVQIDLPSRQVRPATTTEVAALS